MIVTTSKNAGAQIVKEAKSLAQALPGLEYAGRSGRSMEDFAEMAQKRAQNALLVLMRRGENGVLLKFSRGAQGWSWEPIALKISKIEAGGKIEGPCVFEAKSAESKKIAQFFMLGGNVHADLNGKCAKIKVEASGKAAKISCAKNALAKFGYGWLEWQK